VRVLFDQGTPVPLRLAIKRHFVTTAYESGWSTLKNGELLQAAELAGFEVMLTTDANLKYQQNLSTRKIAIIVLTSTSWPRIKQVTEKIAVAVDMAIAGSYIEIIIP
jgi:hypothetical protein